MGAVRMKEDVSGRKCRYFSCIQACWSLVCGMWPSNYWDLLEELLERLHIGTTQDYKPLSTKTSISGFDPPPFNGTGLSSNPKAAELFSNGEHDVDGGIYRQPKWVEEEDEAGVYTMRVSFPGVVKECLKRVDFSPEWFERHAEKWWEANKARVCQRYEASVAEPVKEGPVMLYIADNHKFVSIGGSKEFSLEQVEKWWDANKSMLSQRFNLYNSYVNRDGWVEQDEPGVYLGEVHRRKRIFKFVLFSQGRFCEKQAEQWWDAKRAVVLQRYNFLDGDIHVVEWAKTYEPSVFVRLVSFPGGVNKDIMRVCFGTKLYSREGARQWWAANKSSLYQCYNLPPDGDGAEWVELDEECEGAVYCKPVPVPGRHGLLVYVKPLPEPTPPREMLVYLKLLFDAPSEQGQYWTLVGPGNDEKVKKI